jgi:hypothetical protein
MACCGGFPGSSYGIKTEHSILTPVSFFFFFVHLPVVFPPMLSTHQSPPLPGATQHLSGRVHEKLRGWRDQCLMRNMRLREPPPLLTINYSFTTLPVSSSKTQTKYAHVSK